MSAVGGCKCPRCDKIVYFTEQIIGPAGIYHKSCLTCKTCNKRLDSSNLCDNEKEAYCRPCHTKLFGPKGNRSGATLEGEEAIKKVASGFGSKSSLNSTGNIAPSTESKGKSSERLEKSGGAASAASSDTCPTCTKKVYFAEQYLGPGGIKYHKMCFRCSACRKMLDSTTVNEDKDHQLFCNTDYTKLFGPKGNRAGSTLE